MPWKTVRGRRVHIRPKRKRHLYSNRRDRAYERARFTAMYGREKGRYVYGAVVGKVRREQRAKRAGRRAYTVKLSRGGYAPSGAHYAEGNYRFSRKRDAEHFAAGIRSNGGSARVSAHRRRRRR